MDQYIYIYIYISWALVTFVDRSNCWGVLCIRRRRRSFGTDLTDLCFHLSHRGWDLTAMFGRKQYKEVQTIHTYETLAPDGTLSTSYSLELMCNSDNTSIYIMIIRHNPLSSFSFLFLFSVFVILHKLKKRRRRKFLLPHGGSLEYGFLVLINANVVIKKSFSKTKILVRDFQQIIQKLTLTQFTTGPVSGFRLLAKDLPTRARTMESGSSTFRIK